MALLKVAFQPKEVVSEVAEALQLVIIAETIELFARNLAGRSALWINERSRRIGDRAAGRGRGSSRARPQRHILLLIEPTPCNTIADA